jgi:hypothetical protein
MQNIVPAERRINELNMKREVLTITAPVGIFFMTWMKKTRSNPENANFKNTMKLNLLGAMCNNLFLIVLIVKQHLF